MQRQNRLLNIQVISIFAVVILVFWGSALFFAYLNTEAMKDSAETETKLSAGLLSSHISTALRVEYPFSEDDEYLLNEVLDEMLTEVMNSARLEMGESLVFEAAGPQGQVIYQNRPEGSGEKTQCLTEQQWEEAIRQLDGTRETVSFWFGDNNRFQLSQYLCVVKPVMYGRLYLVMLNPCAVIQSHQRQQFTLFTAVGLILTMVMIVLLANIIFSYRRKLIRLATMDELTGLANRKSFNSAYREYTKTKGINLIGNCSMFLLDIDFFKQINDTYGHSAGDLALKTLAEEIGELTGKLGGFAGRWGGDEFIGILPMPGREAWETMSGFCRRIGELDVGGGFRMTVSAGVVPFDEDLNLARLSEKADKALYVCKENGRNHAVLYGQPGWNWDTVTREVSRPTGAGIEALDSAPQEEMEAGERVEGLAAKVITAAQCSGGTEGERKTAAGTAEAAEKTAAQCVGGAEGERKTAAGTAEAAEKTAAQCVGGAEGERKAAAGIAAGISEAAEEKAAGGLTEGSAEKEKEKAAGSTAFFRRKKRKRDFRKDLPGINLGGEKEKILKSILMGVRWMAPFVAAGGIMIGVAFLIDAASVDLSTLSVAERAQFGSLTTFAAAIKSIGGTTMDFMIPVFAGFMAYGMAGEEAFMAGFVGGFMTIESRSGFIGATLAGIAAGIVIIELQEFVDHMPKVVRKAAPILFYPFFSLVLMKIISWGIITPVAALMGNFFTDLLQRAIGVGRPFAGALAGAMMAVDMGGIVNKAAYNFGVEGLQLRREYLMASVMAGGMVPPLGIAFSIAFRPGKFTAQERGRLAGTAFMGLAFITEGVLPFVFSDFLRVIPCCVAGSALSGLLSAVFGCSLPAPHGGIFVIPLMEHPFLYLAAIAAGTALSGILYAFWKKEPDAAGAVPIPKDKLPVRG